MINFFHECNPPTATAQGRRHTHAGHTYMHAGGVKAAATLRAIFERYAPTEPIHGPVRLDVNWTYPHTKQSRKRGMACYKTTRPDVDNLMKLALDAMTKAGWWADDAQVVDLKVCKFHGFIPGISVECKTIGGAE